MSREGLKKQGYLYKLPVKGLVKKWTKRWFMLYGTSHEGVVRMEYYDNPESMVTSSGKRTIPLRECTDISTTIGSKVHPYAFQFTSQLGHHVLAGESQPEVDSWIASINDAIHEDKIKRRRSKAQSRVATTSGSDIEQSTDKGTTYKNKVDSGTYRVTVEENETSQKMNLSGAYSLELRPSKLSLVAPSKAVIFVLSYRYLKNYGKQSGQFHFETGKNSPIGEGKLVFVTTCSKEIFGVVHNNIKKLKDQVQRKVSSEGAPSTSSQPPTQVPMRVKPPPPKSSQSSAASHTNIGRPRSRQSTEIAANSVPGTYRSSKNMEEDPTSVTSTNQQEGKIDVDPSSLYAVVDKSKKTSKKKEERPKPTVPQPFGTKGSKQKSSHTDQLAPQSARDYRLSTMLVEIDDNAFNDSFDEDEDDNEYDENLEPLTEGVINPFDDDGGITEGNPADGQGAPQQEATANSSPLIDAAQGGPSSPPDNPQVEEEQLNVPPQVEEGQKLNVPVENESTNNSFPASTKPASTEPASTEPAATSNTVQNIMKELDFGFGPGNLKPEKNLGGSSEDKAPTQEDKTTASVMVSNTDNTQANSNETPNLLGDFDFNFGSTNVQPANPTPAGTSGDNTVMMPDLNFDFGDLPAIPGFGTATNDPFSNPISNQPPLATGNIAELDFNSLDTNFFDKLEAMDVKGQATHTAAVETAGFGDDWGDTNTAL